MIDFKNKVYVGSDNRKSLYDCTVPADAKAVIIFIHGYKGYKDWGAWGLMGEQFVKAGFGFLKFNMSHNGGTIDDPIDFPDLDAFGKNTYSYEVHDLNVIITEVDRLIQQELQTNIPIYLLGHSRGGGIAILQSSGDPRINKVVSLAGISEIGTRFPEGEEREKWEEQGVYYVQNTRTGQMMPHYYSMYSDYAENHMELDIESACRTLSIPFLQIHGDMDETVSISEGQYIAEWTDTTIKIIKGANHTFGTKQPWEEERVPAEMQEAIDTCISFFNR